ncbi:MAG TPA: hypothetical protein VKA38_04590 [Draconibacterium sp.]|nr:hypothetical protein [Draconibacterium sp.]
MKPAVFIISMVALLLFAGCKKEKATTTNICVLVDVTDVKFQDETVVSETLPKLLKLMNLDKESGGFSGGEIKFSLINEVSDSKSKQVKLKTAESGLLGENPLIRKDEVTAFFTETENAFSTVISSADWGTEASKIYQKVARELIKMKNSQADKKYMVIYSDMLENSNLFTFYGSSWKAQIEKMIDNPEETLTQLAKKGPALPDLSEFEIYVITHRTPENDEKINSSERFWTTLMEYQGAAVHFNSVLEI